MKYHILAFFSGFLLDLLLGDPYWLPHPIRLIGSLISGLEKKLRNGKAERNSRNELKDGALLVFSVLTITVCVTAILIFAAYHIHPYFGVLTETIMTYQILATKCLKVESMKVCHCLQIEGLEAARKAVSMIVGRDTSVLDEEGVAKAAIETVAENTSDGVIAPMLYTALGGPIAGFFYKAVNTMDSMVGYKNEKYLYFGRAAARLDDLVNYIPSRISAWLMICAAFIGGKSYSGRQAYKIYKRDNRKHASPNSAQTESIPSRISAWLMICAAFIGGKSYSGRQAYKIYKRDNRKHASPNSAQTESVCAGALGIRLAGDACYFGKTVKKPFIGDACRSVEYEDIKRVNKLMYITAWLCEMICLTLMAG